MRGRAALLGVALVACSSGGPSAPPSFGATPFATVTSDGGKLHVAAFSSPDPIARESALELVVTDATSGAPVDGLAIAIVPWMPAMGHGASTLPTVVDQGGGVYVATDLILAMPGDWQLRGQASGPVDDTFVIDASVP